MESFAVEPLAIQGVCTKVPSEEDGCCFCVMAMESHKTGPSDLGKKANSSFSGFWSMESLHKISNHSMDIQIVMCSAV